MEQRGNQGWNPEEALQPQGWACSLLPPPGAEEEREGGRGPGRRALTLQVGYRRRCPSSWKEVGLNRVPFLLPG